jgi:hypothetical protein
MVSGSRFKFADDAVEHFHPETRKRHFYRSYVPTGDGDALETV